MIIRKGFIFSTFLLMFLLSANTGVFGQCDPNTCPAEPWNSVSFQLNGLPNGCQLLVNYEWRICNGKLEIRYLSGPFSETEGCSGFTQSTLRELIDVEILNAMTAFGPVDALYSNCPTEGLACKILGGSCFFRQKCTTTYTAVSNVDCNYDPGNPPAGTTTLTKTTTRWIDCGEDCCTREYRVCKVSEPTELEVRHVGTSIPENDCTDKSIFVPPAVTDGSTCFTVCDPF